jgi:hypothetical protein
MLTSSSSPGRGHNGRVKRLNGMDSMLLYSETPTLHTHTLKVAVIDAAESEFDFDLFRRTLLDRLRLLDPLCYKLIDIPWRLHQPQIESIGGQEHQFFGDPTRFGDHHVVAGVELP